MISPISCDVGSRDFASFTSFLYMWWGVGVRIRYLSIVHVPNRRSPLSEVHYLSYRLHEKMVSMFSEVMCECMNIVTGDGGSKAFP